MDETIYNINSKETLILIGDMNIDMLSENITTKNYVDMLMSNGLECIVKETTREDINKNTKTCIDHMIVRSDKSVKCVHSAVITTTISDHSLGVWSTIKKK